MDLNAFPFPAGIRLAQTSDNQAILDFYSRASLAGKSLSLRSERGPDFFEFLRYQSPRSEVLIYEDPQGVLSGVGTISYRKGYIGGAETELAYLGDFRVAFSRPVIRVWRKFYGDFLRYLSKNTTFPMLTAVIDDNQAATNALVGRENKDFYYRLMTPYKMVNILNRFPFFRSPVAGVSVRRADESDLARLEIFLDHQARAHSFGYCFSAGELRRRLASWTGLKITDFYLAWMAGEIVGSFAPWSPFEAKRNILEKIPFHYQFYRPFVSMPKLGQALRPIYLTHVEIARKLPQSQRGKVFKMMVDHLDWPKSVHMLSFCDFEYNQFANHFTGYLLNQVPMKLFTVSAVGHPLELSPEEMREPGFEIALV